MGSILKADFYRIVKDKMFIILCIVCLGASVALTTVLGFALRDAELGGLLGLGSAFGTAEFLSSPSGTFSIVLTIFTAILIAKDNSTVRNKIICGKSRTEVFFANFIVILTVYMGFALLHLLLSFCVGLIFLPPTYFTLEPYQVVLGVLYKLIGYVAVASFLSLFLAGLRNTALAIVLTLTSSYLLQFLGLILMLVADEKFREFLSVAQYVNIPNVIASTFDANLFTLGSSITYLLTCGTVIGLGIGLGLLAFKKKDLK